MTYRDPLLAARARAEQIRAELSSRAERLTPQLVAQLPRRLRERLQTLEAALERVASDLDGWREIEIELTKIGSVLDRAFRMAPSIAHELNRLPNTIPEVAEPRSYFYFDIYDKRLAAMRRALHEELQGMLEPCSLHDARPRYFDQVERPMLVHASGRFGTHPLRVQVTAAPRHARGGQVVAWTLCCLMLTPVRASAPRLDIEASLVRSLKALMRLERDTRIGDPAIDRRLVIDALKSDAEVIFDDDFRRNLLLLLSRSSRPRLVVSDGLARLDWYEQEQQPSCMEIAAKLVVAIRELPPVALLRTVSGG